MRVIGNNMASKMLQVYKKQEVNKAQEPKKNIATDKIEISSQARDMQIAFQAINNTPDIREEKVRAIIEKIQSGNYEVNSTAIAKKMMGL